MTVTSDQENTEYIFWEAAPGNFTRADVEPYSGNPIAGEVFMGDGVSLSKMTAVRLATNGEPMLIYQDTAGDLRAYDASRQDSEAFNTTLS